MCACATSSPSPCKCHTPNASRAHVVRHLLELASARTARTSNPIHVAGIRQPICDMQACINLHTLHGMPVRRGIHYNCPMPGVLAARDCASDNVVVWPAVSGSKSRTHSCIRIPFVRHSIWFGFDAAATVSLLIIIIRQTFNCWHLWASCAVVWCAGRGRTRPLLCARNCERCHKITSMEPNAGNVLCHASVFGM